MSESFGTEAFPVLGYTALFSGEYAGTGDAHKVSFWIPYEGYGIFAIVTKERYVGTHENSGSLDFSIVTRVGTFSISSGFTGISVVMGNEDTNVRHCFLRNTSNFNHNKQRQIELVLPSSSTSSTGQCVNVKGIWYYIYVFSVPGSS